MEALDFQQILADGFSVEIQKRKVFSNLKIAFVLKGLKILVKNLCLLGFLVSFQGCKYLVDSRSH